MVVGRAIVVVVPAGLAACGGDDDGGGHSAGASDPTSAPDGGTEPEATEMEVSPVAECVSGEADSSRTITIRVDDEVGGFGSIGSRVPTGLTPGTVRVVVEADEENADPITVTLQSEDGAQQIAGDAEFTVVEE
ncbi:hypothetical protein BH24ACT6_BH24ACT6_13580 [soil metagenome]